MLSIQDNCHLLSKVCNLITLPNIPFQMKMREAQGTGLHWLGISTLRHPAFQPLQIYLSCPKMIPLQHKTDPNVLLMPPSSTDPPSLLQMLTPARQLPGPIPTARLSVGSPPPVLTFPPSEFSREDQSSN